LAAVAQDGSALAHASTEWQGDRTVVLVAVAQDGSALAHASEEWQNDRMVVMAAVAQWGHALQHASTALKGDKQVVMAAVTQNGQALQRASNALKRNKEVVIAAVSQYVKALAHASDEMKGIVLAAVARNGWVLQWASEELKKDKQFMQNIITKLHTDNTTLIKEIKQLRTRLTGQESIPVLNADTNPQATIPRPPSLSAFSSSSSFSSSPNSNKKRKHPSIGEVVQNECTNERKKMKVCVDEAIESIQEDAQDQFGYKVVAHNNKISQIDALKQQIKDLQHQIALEK
jgi:hypothetical protein